MTASLLLTCIAHQLLCRESMGDSQRAGHYREGGLHDMRATQLPCYLVKRGIELVRHGPSLRANEPVEARGCGQVEAIGAFIAS